MNKAQIERWLAECSMDGYTAVSLCERRPDGAVTEAVSAWEMVGRDARTLAQLIDDTGQAAADALRVPVAFVLVAAGGPNASRARRLACSSEPADAGRTAPLRDAESILAAVMASHLDMAKLLVQHLPQLSQAHGRQVESMQEEINRLRQQEFDRWAALLDAKPTAPTVSPATAKLQERAAEHLGNLLPEAIRGLTGATTAPALADLGALMSGLSPEQMQTIQGALRPDQMMQLANVWEAAEKARSVS